ILDPYGGSFKVSRGLSSAYPQRVLSSPISEAGITGIAAGMALRGMRPVVEIMFGDFLTLAADQIINHIAKFRWMYNDQVRLPLVIRTPMGGRRGYGPTHSQSLEKHFLGVPGLRVLAPCALGDPGSLLQHAILDDDDPVLFIENKLLYLQPVQAQRTLKEFELSQQMLSSPLISDAALSPADYAPVYTLNIRGAPTAHLTLATYGFTLGLAQQAALRLAYEHEIFVEIVALTQLSPFVIDPILASVGRTSRLLTLEEGSYSLGWGAEILAQVSAAMGGRLGQAARLAARDLPIPASGPLEAQVLPSVEDILRLAQKMV
ncbi:MAG TPA: transketolase C-terminal domain-containing protein, partial [Anaerolineales bacterium]|nr:transketolase C-terminal domain-containing protein [Anaerolineales bacterium]